MKGSPHRRVNHLAHQMTPVIQDMVPNLCLCSKTACTRPLRILWLKFAEELGRVLPYSDRMEVGRLWIGCATFADTLQYAYAETMYRTHEKNEENIDMVGGLGRCAPRRTPVRSREMHSGGLITCHIGHHPGPMRTLDGDPGGDRCWTVSDVGLQAACDGKTGRRRWPMAVSCYHSQYTEAMPRTQTPCELRSAWRTLTSLLARSARASTSLHSPLTSREQAILL